MGTQLAILLLFLIKKRHDYGPNKPKNLNQITDRPYSPSDSSDVSLITLMSIPHQSDVPKYLFFRLRPICDLNLKNNI